MMTVRMLLVSISLLAASPAFAQASDPKAAQNAANWEVFQKLYPPRALAAREEGAVGFKVTLDNKGMVTACEVTHSSGHPLLDQETCNLVTLHAEFKPEAGLAPSQVVTRQGLIAWRLPNGRASLASPTAKKADAQDKMICKKTVRIGTLSGFERTCMTQRDWARQSDETRQPWEDLQGKKGSTSGN